MKIIQPLEDRVLVKPDEMPKQTENGIIIPDTAKDDSKTKTGTVVLIGLDTKAVQIGDIVMYGQYSGVEIDHDGSKHLMMRETDIICVTATREQVVD